MRKTLAIAAMLLAACLSERTATPATDPSANSAKQTEIGAVVEAALAHPSVAQYLHPEVRGRLPVTLAFRSPRDLSSLDATLFGRPVRVVAATQDVPAVILAVSINGGQATVSLDYPLEGLVGTIALQRNGSAWVVSSSELREQRPNNSFKPKPLRGSA